MSAAAAGNAHYALGVKLYLVFLAASVVKNRAQRGGSLDSRTRKKLGQRRGER